MTTLPTTTEKMTIKTTVAPTTHLQQEQTKRQPAEKTNN
jgi:hypothetical protein